MQTKMILGKTLAHQCADIIYENIINMEPGFEPGSRLNLKSLAVELGISETPLKIAIKILETQGVLVIKPRKGTYVSKLSEKDVVEMLDVRAGIEDLAVKLAKGKFSENNLSKMEKCLKQCEVALKNDRIDVYRENDEKFHKLIVAGAHNERLNRLYNDLTASEQIIYAYSPRSKEAKMTSTQEHWMLLNKLNTGELEEILKELKNHWINSALRVLEGYRNYLSLNSQLEE